MMPVPILRQQRLQMVLTARVKKVERLVKDDKLRARQQGRYDADFLLVAGGIFTDVFLTVEYLVTKKNTKGFQTLVNLLFPDTMRLSNECKELPGSKETDEEAFVQIRCNKTFPQLAEIGFRFHSSAVRSLL